MKIAICDDAPADVEILKEYSTKYNADYTISCFPSGQALLQALKKYSFDIIFLDIEMDEPNGYDTAKMIKSQKRKSLIIFTTNSLDYAVRGYGIAFRYLPKPISYRMFATALTEAESVIIPAKVTLQTNTGSVIVNINDIIYFESYSHKIIYHMKSTKAYESQGALTTQLNQLSGNTFIQIHKSFCINLDYVSSTTTTSVQLTDGTILPIGRKRKEAFQTALQNYIRRI